MRLSTIAQASMRMINAKLSPIELVVLDELDSAERAGKPHTLATIAVALNGIEGAVSSSLSRHLWTLHEKGYVTRRPVPNDRRSETHHIVRDKVRELTANSLAAAA